MAGRHRLRRFRRSFRGPSSRSFRGKRAASRAAPSTVSCRTACSWNGRTPEEPRTYEIEGAGKPYKNPWQYANNIPVDSKNTKQTALFDVSGSAAPYFYTVCAVNIRGRTCSARVSTSLLTGKEGVAVQSKSKVSTPVPAAKLAASVFNAVNTPTPGTAVRKAGNLALGGQPTTLTLAFAEPAANARAAPGTLRVRLLPTKATGEALLQLTTLDGWPPLVKSWRVPISTLVNGTVLPASVTGDRLGRWSMTAKPDPGSAGTAVVFQLAR